jgi:CxC2 like cysteine cluster associated with KDZ transposases
MEQWLQLRSKYLSILLEMEGRPSAPECSTCGGHAPLKCMDCFGVRHFCQDCCVEAHRSSPFHRPLLWTATHYTPVSLHSLGFVLFLGHHGKPCPQTVEVCSYLIFYYLHILISVQGIKAAYVSNLSRSSHKRHGHPSLLGSIQEDLESLYIGPQLPTPEKTPQPEGPPSIPEISDDLFDHPEEILEQGDGIPSRMQTAPSGNPILTIVDRSGVFEMEIVFCICSDDGKLDEQLLQSGLFPATFKQPKTMFTFSVLDDFLKDNLECKTTAQQYYSKLQSVTSKMFPNHVPVCISSHSHFQWILMSVQRTCINSY